MCNVIEDLILYSTKEENQTENVFWHFLYIKQEIKSKAVDEAGLKICSGQWEVVGFGANSNISGNMLIILWTLSRITQKISQKNSKIHLF